ncbi:zinc-dependent alcohol dehydrogenase family protein [Rhizosaccharibacter radicis]|uniref:Zinc-dependent alcohol dehydrogenase family protein n=1 Tax=Rhizosaccharibacter radicis TaxID=2782605 RepID=A0ABT1VTY2_9PROT|nr:zinc-dependent alcohol dehydrogenase family protein [Acetobacteraceae bacterium KSS12]
MKAILYDAPRSFRYADVPEPRIDDDEVLIRIRACGVCGTDLHIHEGEFAPRFPLIPGHEFAGEIAAAGPGAGNWQVGQRVVANCTRACGHCFFCRRGDTLRCENFIAYGIQLDGGFAEYLRIKGREVYALSSLSWREAVMVEPTSCAVHGLDVLARRPGSDVLIFGAGPTGQVLAQLLKRNGAARLTVAAPRGPKLALAERLSADRVVEVDRADPRRHRAALRDISANGFDYVVEATGVSAMCAEALHQVRRGGTLLVYGVYPENTSFAIDPLHVFRNEITIKGSFAEINDFGRALAYLEGGDVKVDELVTDEFALGDWEKALAHAHGRGGIKSVMIPPDA